MIFEKLRVDSRSGFEEVITISVSRRESVLSWLKRRRRSRRIVVNLIALLMLIAIALQHDAVIGTTSISDFNLRQVDSGSVVTVKGVLVDPVSTGYNPILVHIRDSTGSYRFTFNWEGPVPLNGSIVVIRGTFRSYWPEDLMLNLWYTTHYQV